MRIVRNLCLYRRRAEPGCFVPNERLFPPVHQAIRPHIFADSELVDLLAVARTLARSSKSPLHPENMRLAIVVLSTTGLRRGELTRLAVGDYDPPQRTLAIRESKFHKSRLVPLSADTAREIEHLIETRDRPRLPAGAETPLLWHRRPPPARDSPTTAATSSRDPPAREVRDDRRRAERPRASPPGVLRRPPAPGAGDESPSAAIGTASCSCCASSRPRRGGPSSSSTWTTSAPSRPPRSFSTWNSTGTTASPPAMCALPRSTRSFGTAPWSTPNDSHTVNASSPSRSSGPAAASWSTSSTRRSGVNPRRRTRRKRPADYFEARTTRANGTQSGAVTHHHDHSATGPICASFNARNTKNTPPNNQSK